MAIKHTFVSAIADGADATLVRPSNWNANHTIDNNTITYAMIQAVTAGRILGSIAGGNVAELTPSQIFDLVSSTNGVLLTRTGGTWAALANWSTDNGDLVANTNAAPVAPASGKAKLFATDLAGRPMIAQLAPAGAPAIAQPFLGQKNFLLWTPAANTATMGVVGAPAVTATGTATARAFATTSLVTASKRVGYVSAATAAAVGGVRSPQLAFWRGNAAGLGGFTFVMRFAVSDAVLVTTGRTFCGLNNGGAPTDVDPSTLTNLVGIGADNGDTTLQLYAAGAAAQARTSLGASFPINTGTNNEIYELALYAPPNGSSISYRVTRLSTGNVATGTISAGASLLGNTLGLAAQLWRSNGATAAAVGIDCLGLYMESDY